MTARSTHQAFIRVSLEGSNRPKETSDCPLCIVPSLTFVYPLLKDDTVWVYSPSDSPTSYYLYAIDNTTFKIPEAVTDAVTFPSSGSAVSFPSAPDTVAVQYITDKFCIIAMHDDADAGSRKFATLIQSGSLFTLYYYDEATPTNNKIISYTTDEGSYEIKCGKFVLETGDLLKIKAKSGLLIESSSDFEIKSNNVDLKNIINQLMSSLDDLYSKIASVYDDVLTSVVVTPAGPGSISSVVASVASKAALAAQQSTLSSFKSTSVDVFFQET